MDDLHLSLLDTAHCLRAPLCKLPFDFFGILCALVYTGRRRDIVSSGVTFSRSTAQCTRSTAAFGQLPRRQTQIYTTPAAHINTSAGAPRDITMNGTATTAAMSQEEQSQRGSGGSSFTSTRSTSGRSRQQNPQQQLSTIEKSVTHLLVATKQLLETLTMWSTQRASESEVSDVYVRLGYEFNIACRAFNAIGVETNDLGPVPDMLRGILEETLSQDASQQSLEKYLPRIRDIIINLLHGLKKKQQRLRQRSNREGAGESSTRPPRQASTASTLSIATNLTEQLENIPSRYSSQRSFAQRQGSGDLSGPDLPPRTTSVPGGRTSPKRHGLSPQNSISVQQPQQDSLSTSASTSSLSSNTMQNIPVIAPYPEGDTMPTNQGYGQDQSSPERPKPPPKANDALTALQRGGELERRASRRFSAYQIQKHLGGGSMSGIGAIPPSQNSPVPNRGRDARESMNAVRSRASMLHSRARSRNQKTTFEASPNRDLDVRRISEADENTSQHAELEAPPAPFANDDQADSPLVRTPEDKLAGFFPAPPADNSIGATLNGPVEEPFTPGGSLANDEHEEPTSTIKRGQSVRMARDYTPPVSQFLPEDSPQPGKQLTLFLQYKSKIKKFVLPDGGQLTLARLQLAFIEKFNWNTHNNGVDLPDIYIQDPVSGVRHELDDINDVKERAVLVLNVEALDEVKRHFDDGIGGLRRIVEGIKTSVDDQQSALQRVSERQQETAKELASLAAAPPPVAASRPSSTPTTAARGLSGNLKEVQSLRRDLAVVRQTYKSFMADTESMMSTLRSKALGVKKAAADTLIPDMDEATGRSYVNKGKKTLGTDSERIVDRVDSLQDIVEDLRKDVVQRGVRPLARQLEDVSKDISTATAELKKMQEFLKREKPIWTKIWEKELQVVCDDRDLLTMQEELAADLEDDLDKAAQTFALVEQATKQQNLANPNGHVGGSRSSSRTLAIDQGADPHKAKDGVLGEVRALQPNHESRLEAIERAERARQRELENRQGGEFQRELGNFVEEGKLKKTGGHEEVERIRQQREEKARQEAADLAEQRRREGRKRQEEVAAAAAAETAAAEPQAPVDEVIDNGDKLEIPTEPHSESHSPEPNFEDAKEEVNTPSTEAAP
ncbi:Bud site selection protein 6 [Fulvia fulva]|uniref:Bud site selection protein 6 n=1 Tax=Passalora fulva TaxID=5499 RepID=A0A9Q8PKF8_PASFU|nr:Bud site selection protein 6 [Fulvia fulva]UJO24156.1 Bud site selection protein 6 [Fulvia fulva]WPV36670.1 Bud site selection protein 6 [Fulvia fulva]